MNSNGMMMMIPIVLVVAAAIVAFALHKHRKIGRRQRPDPGRTNTNQLSRDHEEQPWR